MIEKVKDSQLEELRRRQEKNIFFFEQIKIKDFAEEFRIQYFIK